VDDNITAMDDILKEVKELTTIELRKKLIEVGEKVGPITATTQALFQKRLAKRLYENQHPDLTTDEARDNDVVNNNTLVNNVKVEEVVHKPITEVNDSSEEPSIFYGVCLPHGIERKDTEGWFYCLLVNLYHCQFNKS
jgi:hypothetical protein